MTDQIFCPICQRLILGKGYFGTPDHTGVVGYVYHKTKKIKDILGYTHIQQSDRCFLNQEQWNKIP